MGELDHPLEVPRFELSRIPADRAILHLKTWTHAPACLPDLAPGAGADARVLSLGPGEWLMMSESMDGPGLHRAVAAVARAAGVAAVDLSDGMAGLQLEGTAARDVLSTSCGLDLHPTSFSVGSCTRTRLAQLPVVIACTGGAPRYELYIGASYLPYLEAWLRDAATPGLQTMFNTG